MYHALEFPTWKQNATVPMSIKLPQFETIHDAYSYPEYVSQRRQVECKLIDPTHILTNIRTHICGKGYKFIGKDACLRVSERDDNVLNRAYITELVDKQSAPIALKFFSQQVQAMMFEMVTLSKLIL